MVIEELKIKNFRNLKEKQVSFCKTTNLIHGRNGVGKTSILEAIFLLGFGKSFLVRKKSQLINDQEDQFFLNMDVIGNDSKNKISAHYKSRFSLLLDQKKTNIFEINGYLYPVLFSSSDYNLYIENKPYTRKMMDRFIFGVDTLYLRYLLSYNRGLKQKNHLLRTTRNLTELTSWNKILSELAEKLVGTKMTFIEKLNVEIEKKFHPRLKVQYKPSLSQEKGPDKYAFFNQMEALKQKELIINRTVTGPHLDTFEILLDGKSLQFYSSGEKKINLLMLYISFIELFKKEKNDYPVFLVDDYDTAIDAVNIDFLIESYPQMQVIATSVNQNSKFDRSIRLNKEN